MIKGKVTNMFTRIISFITALVMGTLFALNIGTIKPESYIVLRDVSYGEDEQQTFDLIIPEGIGNELSLAVYIHGGAWLGGDKSLEENTYKPMAEKRGMISANVNYRLLSMDKRELNCQTLLQDIDDAMNKIVEVCAENGYKIKKALMWGESAGGHLALMYSYTCKDKSPVEIGLCYSICGPTDMTDTDFYSKTDFSVEQVFILQSALTGMDVNESNILDEKTQEELRKVSPAYNVSESSVPTIFNSCGRDKMIPTSNAKTLEKALKYYGVDYYYAHFKRSGHCGRRGPDFITYTALDGKLGEMIDKYVK